ncbi:MAG: NUDIX domain-containing protein [Pirellulales bacterium]
MSCGVILFREEQGVEFLLLRKPGRFDFPKGHVDPGESELECALRELREETGVPSDWVELDPAFRYAQRYPVWDKYLKANAVKTLVLFLGWLHRPVELVMTEHDDFEWRRWQPPHRIQKRMIDGALEAVQRHVEQQAGGAAGLAHRLRRPAD